MEPDFWHRRWRKNEIGFHQGDINRHLRAHWAHLGAAPGALVFVPLCGKSRDMLWLREQGHRVLGVELSAIAVRDFFVENELPLESEADGPFIAHRSGDLTVLEGDFFALDAARLAGVGAVFDRASLIAFPPEMRPRYARHLLSLLPGGTRLLLLTMEYPQDEMQGPPFSVREDEVLRLFGEDAVVERIHQAEVLHEHARFIQKGLTSLTEKVYRLIRR